jgi:flagellar L-ring protein precursor FlgH
VRRDALVLFVALALPGCGPPHIAPFTPRQRLYKAGGYAQLGESAKPSIGSLYSDAMPGYLEDTRAVRVGDVLMINVDESSDAQGAANTSLSKSSSGTIGMNHLMGVLPMLRKAFPSMDPSKMLDYASQSQFAGTGATTRNGQLSGTIAVRVVREMPNGDLFLEGTKVVLINNEEYHLYISGLVRPTDIAQDNSVLSSRIADAQIEFTGRGDLADQQRKGWFAKFVDWINPF